MDTKIQELTDKIYKEGVEKGNEEAGRIIADAEARKQTLLNDAERRRNASWLMRRNGLPN